MQTKKGGRLKIAVQLSGNLRTFEECAPLLKHYLLDRYDSDIFIHTWDQLDHAEQTYLRGPTASLPTLPAAVKEKVVALYQPKEVVFEPIENIKKVEGFFRDQPLSAQSGVFSLQAVWNTMITSVAANNLRKAYSKQQGLHYDFVIRTRPDIALLEPVIIENFLPLFQFHHRSCVLFPGNYFIANGKQQYGEAHDYGFTFAGANDTFFICPESVMDNIMDNLMDNFDSLYRDAPKLFPKNMARYLDVETMFYYHIQRLGIMTHFGRINKMIRRLDTSKDNLQLFQDRLENSRQHFVDGRPSLQLPPLSSSTPPLSASSKTLVSPWSQAWLPVLEKK
ncbi:MAG: hypothetical protein ORN57_00900 [Alphaproteobacteria bacterium]|nr:hypothetical protein [Alphaproteobacteria bacterium]